MKSNLIMNKYKNGAVYKLVCNDKNITDCYVGSTCNLTRRKNQHKNVCNNENTIHYNYPLYKCIRENGGWDNWKMVVLEKYECDSKVELEMREHYYYEKENATLNKNKPANIAIMGGKKEYEKHYQNQYRKDNADTIKQYRQEYRQKNYEKLNEKFTCECGGRYTKKNQSTHFKSIKHRTYLDKKTSQSNIDTDEPTH